MGWLLSCLHIIILMKFITILQLLLLVIMIIIINWLILIDEMSVVLNCFIIVDNLSWSRDLMLITWMEDHFITGATVHWCIFITSYWIRRSNRHILWKNRYINKIITSLSDNIVDLIIWCWHTQKYGFSYGEWDICFIFYNILLL